MFWAPNVNLETLSFFPDIQNGTKANRTLSGLLTMPEAQAIKFIKPKSSGLHNGSTRLCMALALREKVLEFQLILFLISSFVNFNFQLLSFKLYYTVVYIHVCICTCL